MSCNLRDMQTVLVTGVNGFVGEHLVKELTDQSYSVIGVGREANAQLGITDLLLQYVSCDLINETQVSQLPLAKADAIINLAGLAQVGASFKDPEAYQHVNVAVLTVIGGELLRQGLSPRVVAISTGAVYQASQPLPLTEDSELIREGSPYALSKVAMEMATKSLQNKGLDCIIARPFNHLGPGQGRGFLLPDLYAQIVAAKKTGQPIKTGNLKTKRDYTDVRDVVKAYVQLAISETLRQRTYNVCSGKSVSGETILNLLLEITNSTKQVQMEQDPALLRPNDPIDIYGSYQRLKTETGWQPTIAIKKTIQDFIAAQD